MAVSTALTAGGSYFSAQAAAPLLKPFGATAVLNPVEGLDAPPLAALHSRARFVLVAGTEVVHRAHPGPSASSHVATVADVSFSSAELATFFRPAPTPFAFLGAVQPAPKVVVDEADDVFFACELGPDQTPVLPPSLVVARFRTPYFIQSPDPLAVEVVRKAISTVNWHRSVKYCSYCGSAVTLHASGLRAKCSSPACGHEFFPTYSPCVICLVTTPDAEHLLLSRRVTPKNPNRDNLYEVFTHTAGYVDRLETPVRAVVRELAEELQVYLPSEDCVRGLPLWQSWGAVSSAVLMLPMVVRAELGLMETARPDGHEIATAKIVSRAEVARAMARDPTLGWAVPGEETVAYTMLKLWLDRPELFRD
jgi:NADH pyrophosphatase NudC (nudix superfamily)